ncbi:hypothetical protein FQZ97_817420 [compost metagenome]
MRVRQFLHRLGTEDRRHLRFERLGEQAVDVVVAVVHEHEAAIAHVPLEIAPLGRVELHQLVPGQVTERCRQHARVGQRQHVFLRVHAQGGVVDQRRDEVGRHARVHVPVAGVVFQPGEPEVVGAGGVRLPGQCSRHHAAEHEVEELCSR